MKNNTTLYDQLQGLTQKYTDTLRRLPLRPAGWLPHIVYIEEEGDYPVYTMYKLEEIRKDGSCVLLNPATGERFNDRQLYEINIDWLDTVVRWYYECCREQHLGKDHVSAVLRQETDAEGPIIENFMETFSSDPLPLEDTVSLFQEWKTSRRFSKNEFVKLTDEVITILRNCFGNEAAVYRENMLLQVLYNKWDEAGIRIVGVRNVREDDIQEIRASYLRPATAKETQDCIITLIKTMNDAIQK